MTPVSGDLRGITAVPITLKYNLGTVLEYRPDLCFESAAISRSIDGSGARTPRTPAAGGCMAAGSLCNSCQANDAEPLEDGHALVVALSLSMTRPAVHRFGDHSLTPHLAMPRLQ